MVSLSITKSFLQNNKTMLQTVQPLYNTPRYNTDFAYTQSHCVSQFFFYHGILQRNEWKMTISWSFPEMVISL